ncbi:hypothetical protein EV356DRAFT_576911 [Viridothelium virens]|uniref:Cupin type-2 domain-containing protein n=1 Tax=Viridothelium virens TaxID=1048519 RepID=A0A6A6H8M9_VIRVR|nr:hypothetical protein EV356DRAFT_576911 [Viridothelium virens]
MASSHDTLLDNGLPSINRFITDHDSSGKAIFSNAIPDTLPWQTLPDGARFSLSYATNETPVELNQSQDVTTYAGFLENKPGITVPGGTVCRLVDAMPGATSPMHRTVSLDYAVVLEGVMELVLDSGETKVMKRGDIAIQRGTMHAWRNVTPDGGWGRMLYVLQEAKPVLIDGKALQEDYGGIPGVRASK